MEAIAKNLQDEIDVRMVNLKDDDASAEGTQAIRLLVQKLHEAQGNSSLQLVVQALLRANNLATSHNKERTLSPDHVSLQCNPRASDRKENSSEGAPQRRRVPHSPVCASKRRRPSASSDSISSQSGNSERGRHRQWRRRSPSPPTSPPLSTESRESSSTPTRSSHKAHSHKRRKRTYRAWKRARKMEKFKEGGKNVSFLVL